MLRLTLQPFGISKIYDNSTILACGEGIETASGSCVRRHITSHDVTYGLVSKSTTVSVVESAGRLFALYGKETENFS